MILVQNVVKHFGGVAAVDGVDMKIERGSITGLIGPNGAGKTTLFNLIAGNIAPSKGSIFLDGEDVTQTIRTERVGEFASQVAAVPELRKALFDRQRAFILPPGLVADGRDMATSIFPEAEAKIYLTASAESRAERRVKQLQGMGLDVKMNDILANIQSRDQRDMQRAVAPLRPAEDAYQIDSSNLTIDQVFQLMTDYVDQRIKA